MIGKIVKGIAGFYYVDVVETGIYECRAKGVFRKDGRKPLVGDNVRIEVLDDETGTGNLVEILPRKNELIRPAVANVDQAMVIFAMDNPKPNRMLLDRFLVMMERQEVSVVICFNKTDLVDRSETEELQRIYESAGYQVITVSALQEEGIGQVRKLLLDKVTVVAGPSGVGKSSLTNLLQEEIRMDTGEISRKLKRGKHTTRHSQVLRVNADTYLMDTPGFSSLYTEDMEKDELRFCFPEFAPMEGKCRFHGCLHDNEPDCAVKEALARGGIAPSRYESYQYLLNELKEKRRY